MLNVMEIYTQLIFKGLNIKIISFEVIFMCVCGIQLKQIMVLFFYNKQSTNIHLRVIRNDVLCNLTGSKSQQMEYQIQ